MTNRVHLVGSINLASAEDAFRACGRALGDHVAAVPDGETDTRSGWIHHLAYTVLYPNTDLEVLNRPRPVDGEVAWYAASHEDQWIFQVRPGVERIGLRELGYAEIAADSYALLLRLRDEGVVPADVRLQVELPFPDGAIPAFVRDHRSLDLLILAYQEALERELETLTRLVPAADLSVQWDVCWEVLYSENAIPWSPAGDPWDRFVGYVQRLGPLVPEEALAGYHLCYGDWEGRHLVEPRDLGLVVRMANAIVEHSGRRVDFVHMPVPIDRDDDPYFAPLDELSPSIGRLFLGLVHARDGLEGARRRARAARRHIDRFGVSTECGMGRQQRAAIGPLLDLHRAIAEDVVAEPAE